MRGVGEAWGRRGRGQCGTARSGLLSFGRPGKEFCLPSNAGGNNPCKGGALSTVVLLHAAVNPGKAAPHTFVPFPGYVRGEHHQMKPFCEIVERASKLTSFVRRVACFALVENEIVGLSLERADAAPFSVIVLL